MAGFISNSRHVSSMSVAITPSIARLPAPAVGMTDAHVLAPANVLRTKRNVSMFNSRGLCVLRVLCETLLQQSMTELTRPVPV